MGTRYASACVFEREDRRAPPKRIFTRMRLDEMRLKRRDPNAGISRRPLAFRRQIELQTGHLDLDRQ
ncbi:hypothetical protein [Methylosinus sp. sav-2]|uniref:hypothetical protein n=1 Tax=Methylosinus sp. sav-2 TaxID=2485168 RepID=UPI001065CB93|nr:hypothetical protein [Methylosinus sp. sav-2]